VKICGVREPDAIAAAVRGGADAVGFVFAPSPRRVTIAEARALAEQVPPFVARVAVLWRPLAQEVTEVLEGFAPDVLQCEPDHRGRPPRGARAGFLAVLHDGPDVLAQARVLPPGATVLIDSAGRGGRGAPPDRARAAALARERPLVLAGGLTPDNVAEVIHEVRPWAVDVSSGVETSPGRKDPALIERFLEAVRRADGDRAEGRSGTWATVLGC
jgi:phosphoribosylanthranilate isomerase